MINLKARYKTLVLTILVAGLIGGAFFFADKNVIKSLTSPGDLWNEFRSLDAYVQQGKKDFQEENLSAGLFNKNRSQEFSEFVQQIRKNRLSQGDPQAAREELERIKTIALTKLREYSEVVLADSKKAIQNYAYQLFQTINTAYKEESISPQETVRGPDVPQKSMGAGQKQDLKEIEKLVLEKTNQIINRSQGQLEEEKLVIEKEVAALAPAPGQDAEEKVRSLGVANANTLFRLFIWRDMFQEFWQEKAWGGISFGKPQRSVSLEVLAWASNEWQRDGWITPHNSFFHVIYRAGIIGVILLAVFFAWLADLIRTFFMAKSFIGSLLICILLYWITMSCFLVVLELPYYAIPFWCLWGVTAAYADSLKNTTVKASPRSC